MGGALEKLVGTPKPEKVERDMESEAKLKRQREAALLASGLDSRTSTSTPSLGASYTAGTISPKDTLG